MVIFAPVSLTSKDSTFRAHSAFICFVRISEQRLFPCTALTDWGFVTATENVYCAVRNASLSIGIIQVYVNI